MYQRSISCVGLWSCLLIMLSATPSLAEGGDAGEIASQFTGTSCSQPCTLTPPDMGASVGPGQVVQILNGSYTVYSRAGSVLDSTTDSTFWTECRRANEHFQQWSERSTHHLRPHIPSGGSHPRSASGEGTEPANQILVGRLPGQSIRWTASRRRTSTAAQGRSAISRPWASPRIPW